LKAAGSITICNSMLSEEANIVQLADIIRRHRLVIGAQREPLWRHMTISAPHLEMQKP